MERDPWGETLKMSGRMNSRPRGGEIRKKPQRILVLRQDGRSERRIRGIENTGKGRFRVDIVTITGSLPEVIDDTRDFLPRDLNADLVLDYLKHPDLSYDLARICKEKGIPEVATRKRIRNNWTYSPPICCALPRYANLGEYGRLFGSPELKVETGDGVLCHVSVLRGAPCGATQEAAVKMRGVSVDEAVQKIGLQTQFCCAADPADWDPFYGKSPVHLAADLHTKALMSAVERFESDT